MIMAATDLNTVLDGVPFPARVALAIALALGLVLWVFGRRLARPFCAMMGLVIGAMLGLVISQSLGGARVSILAIGLGAVAGLAAAIVLFRLWMGVSLGLVLALALPASVLAWQGLAAPADAQKVQDQFIDLPTTQRADAKLGLQDRLAAVYSQQTRDLRVWWEGLPDGTKAAVMLAAVVGLGGGLFTGVVFPNVAAMMQSALLGALLIFTSGRQLLLVYAPRVGAYLPAGPRLVLLMLGLITLVGVLIQWTLSRRRADK